MAGPCATLLKVFLPCSIAYLCATKCRLRSSPSKLRARSGKTESLGESESLQDSQDSTLGGVSRRVSDIASSSFSAMSNAWDLLETNPYHPTDNPNGCINLAVAENKLLLDLLHEWFETHPEALLFQKEGPMSLGSLSSYPDFGGILPLRKAMADFMGMVLSRDWDLKLDPSEIVIASGATSILEILAFCLGDPGDAFLIPAPYYPGFNRDILWRSQVQLIPFHESNDRGMDISFQSLSEAWENARKQGVHVRALLISSPCNPTGRIYPRKTLSMILKFCRTHQIHCISDEVYAGSVYSGAEEFVSMMSLAEAEKGDLDRLHVVYSLSKDLGLAGFRFGVLHTRNPRVRMAASNLSRMCLIPMHTQLVLSCLLSDLDFMRRCLETNRNRLRERWNFVEERLNQAGVDFVVPCAGLFVWINLSPALSSVDSEGESHLLTTMAKEFGIVMNPGHHCQSTEFGWYRLCFAGLEQETLATALDRLHLLVSKFNSPHS